MRLFPIAAALTLAACRHCAKHTIFRPRPDSQYIPTDAHGNEIAVKVNLAEPLANGGLVYQTDAYHVNLAKNHLWAAPLDGALSANLSNKLNRLNPHRTFVPASRSQSSQTLKVYIEAFQGSYQGQTTISGYAQWPDGRSKPFNAITPQQGDGYTAMLESLENGLSQVAEMIAY